MQGEVKKLNEISIHAPREGSDDLRDLPAPACRNFNPRSPRGERLAAAWDGLCAVLFQSTLPARGATLQDFIKCNTQKNFNPRSPRGERRSMPLTMPKTSPFQSTLPARGATQQGLDVSVMDDISIHAPREGSDTRSAGTITGGIYFNPRSPRGERRRATHTPGARCVISIHAPREGSDRRYGKIRWCQLSFQSTLPARGATL